MAKRDNQKKNSRRNTRADHQPGLRQQYEKNRKIIIASQDVCGICGQPVDKSLKAPHPLSASIDHKIPVSLGGSPIDLDNMQLAHLVCNERKQNRMQRSAGQIESEQKVDNRNLPWTFDWTSYRSSDND